MKASARAARHIAKEVQRRAPLNKVLDRLERTVAPKLVLPPSPPKQPILRRRSSSLKPLPPGQQQPGSSQKQVAVSARTSQKQVAMSARTSHVAELYEAFVVRQEVEHAKVKYSSDADQVTEQQQPPLPSVASSAQSKADASKVPGAFLDVLKVYYPHFSRPTLEMMVRDARDAIAAVDRKRFVAKAKGPLSDRLRHAFLNADKDKSGSMEVEEFIESVTRTSAQPPGFSKERRASPDEMRALLLKIFAEGDTNEDGTLSFDEFLEICAAQPWLIQAFDKILESGVTRKLKNEQMRLQTLFRHPVSPRSRCILSPGGSKFRPSLYNLRRADEVGEVLARADAQSDE